MAGMPQAPAAALSARRQANEVTVLGVPLEKTPYMVEEFLSEKSPYIV
jgi:hypothetical protein